MFNKTSIYPFLAFLSLPCLLILRHGDCAIGLIRSSCVPAGVLISALSATSFLGLMIEPEEARMGSRLAFAPIALGIIYSYLFSLLGKYQNKPFSVSRHEGIILGISAFILLAFTVHFTSMSAGAFVDLDALLIVLVVTLVCFVYDGFGKLNVIEKLNRAALFSCITAAVVGIALYSYGAAVGPRYMGPPAALAFITSAYGAFMAYVTILLGGQNSYTEKEARYFDWHLIESWAFLALMTLPPLTLLESFA